jgi:hypothetical protein
MKDKKYSIGHGIPQDVGTGPPEMWDEIYRDRDVPIIDSVDSQGDNNSDVTTRQQSWEYHIDRGRLDEARLAELGAKGWELASVVSREDTELWVFKKPKE